MYLRSAILFLVAASILFGQTPGIKTDLNLYPEPSLPTLPAPGDTFVDPTFGTTILRVTGPSDGDLNYTIYSYWPSFNKDNSHFHASCDNVEMLWDFDPVQFRVSNKRPLFAANPLGAVPRGDMAIWSGTNPDELYSFEGPRLWKYNIATYTYVLLKDFSPYCPILWQMSRSMDDRMFAFTQKNDSSIAIGYILWNRDRDSVVLDRKVEVLDEVQIDKTGRFLVVKTYQPGKDVFVWDLQNMTVDSLTDGGPDYSPGHSDNGSGIVVGEDNHIQRLTVRNLQTPHTLKTVVDYRNDWSIAGHISVLADNEDWVQVSTVTAPAAGQAVFHNEIFQASTDGTQKIRRLCHHRNVYGASEIYEKQFPFANISRDGRFVAFCSNWGTLNGRKDVFILKIPPAPGDTISPETGVVPFNSNFNATTETFRILPGRSSVVTLHVDLGNRFVRRALSVRDMQGRVVGRINLTGSGAQTVRWNAECLGNGVYFFEAKPFLLLR